jgi:hypothetical protein
MSAEWVTAIATVGTFVVIAGSAVAALMQLRHMHDSNQMLAYNECRATMDSEHFRNALISIRGQLAARLKDPNAIEEIVASEFAGDYAGIRLVANLFESLGLFVRTGMMEERIACELWSGIIVATWDALRPLTALLRERVDPAIWLNFEYITVLCNRYNKRFPTGEYPAGVERMPL